MALVRIEWIPVQVANLGLFGLDHLQLVYQPDDLIGQTGQEDWFVLEGTRDLAAGAIQATLGVEGSDGQTRLSEANVIEDPNHPIGIRYPTAEELVDLIGTPQSRGSTPISFGDPFTAWQTMAVYGAEINDQKLNYIGSGIPLTGVSTVNSTSVIASVLNSVGLDLTNHFPSGLRFSPGYKTLIGTTNDDELTIVRQFENLVGGVGEDTFFGTNGGGNERFYGGVDDDRFNHSSGFDLYHGGESYKPYAEDGLDTLVLDGVGVTFIRKNPDHIEHLVAQYLLLADGQDNWVFSVERYEWLNSTDKIYLGPGLELLDDGLILDLKGQQNETGEAKKGDVVFFEEFSDGLLINAAQSNALFVEDNTNHGQENGLWIENAEWIVGSSDDDRIYLAAEMRGAEGGEGDDLIDARLVDGSGGTGPEDNGAELHGGAGDDTLIASNGQSVAFGGEGDDTFILTTLNNRPDALGSVELTISDAESTDSLLAPINLFNQSGGSFEGSELLPVLGAIGSYDDLLDGQTLRFEWRPESTLVYSTDLSVGLIPFFGSITYELDGTDLLIDFQSGTTLNTFTGDPEDGGVPITLVVGDPTSETTVRVTDFDEGDLGIVFHEVGDPVQVGTDSRGALFSFPGRDAAVQAMTNGGTLLDPIDARPDAPSTNPNLERPTSAGSDQLVGGQGDDILTSTTSSSTLIGEGGNDNLTGGNGDDILDGGQGNDTLNGGNGNDDYRVDSTGDIVNEAGTSGTDSVYASISYTLSAGVENLFLSGAATTGTGNERDNQLTGNEGDNVLAGGSGNDILFGNFGNDTLSGGDGNDTYLYVAGTGDAVINDTSSAADNDRLLLNGDLTTSDLSFHRASSNPNDLIVITSAGDRLTITDYYTGAAAGIDTFVFDTGNAWDRTALDAAVGSLSATGNEAPIARDDLDFIIPTATFTIQAAALLANDRDNDGDTLTITSVSTPSIGSATLLASGGIEVSVPSGTTDAITFSYTISDGQGGQSTASTSFTLFEDAVVGGASLTAVDDSGFEAADIGTLVVSAGRLFANDQTTDPQSLALTSVGNPTNGTVSIDANGDIIFVPTNGYGGAASFTYTVSDGSGASSTANVNLTVFAVNTITGDAANNTINGTTGWDAIDAGDGNDVVTAGNGADDVFGGNGKDSIDGGSGADILDGGAGNDEISGGGAFDIIYGGDNGDKLWGDAGNDTVSGGSGADEIYGGSGTDVLYGDNSGDTIDGGSGTDYVYGGSGADVLSGGSGRDYLYGEASNDTISGNDGNDDIYGGGGFDIISGDEGNDQLWGEAGNDSISGGNGADALSSGSGSDTLDGGAGNDALTADEGSNTVIGGTGNDLMLSGSGSDTFVFAMNDGNDTIDGFSFASSSANSADKLDLTAYGFATSAEVTALTTQSGNDIVIQLDTANSITITLASIADLSASDLLL
ncbi:MAG: cadherin-like domain-containing protein [Pseudomonadota bacterium]